MLALISVLTLLAFAPQDAILHRAPVEYPPAAKEKGIQGSVLIEVDLDAEGLVTDARVLSGPQELRNSALRSVLRWHWSSKAMQLPATTKVKVDFKLQENSALTRPDDANRVLKALASNRTLQQVVMPDLTDSARESLFPRLPLRYGEPLTDETIDRAVEEVRAFDEHLRVNAIPVPDNGVAIEISSRNAAASTPSRIRVGGSVQQAKLVQQPKPVYPPDAKAQRIQGTVRLAAVINRDGTMKSLELLSGDPVLAQAAMEAVKQWPTLLNGQPVEVATEIQVNFTLSQ